LRIADRKTFEMTKMQHMNNTIARYWAGKIGRALAKTWQKQNSMYSLQPERLSF